MSDPTGPESGKTGGPSVRDSTIGGDSIQIGSARDVMIISGADRDARNSPARRRRWIRPLLAGGALLLAAAAAGTWPAPIDLGRDLAGIPAVTGTVVSTIQPGDRLATATDLSPAEYALLARDPSMPHLTRLMASHRAARIGEMTAIAILQGRRSNLVRIIDVRPRILRSGPPPEGACVTVAIAGGPTEYTIEVDLDRQRPDGGRSRYLPESIDLSYGEHATVEMLVRARRRWYEWDMEVVYAAGSGTRLERLFLRGPDGEPFRVTGPARRYAAVYNDPSRISIGYRRVGTNRSCDPAG